MNLQKNQNDYLKLYKTTPWYNFNLYLDCCYSLGVSPSISSYIKYNKYYKTLFTETSE